MLINLSNHPYSTWDEPQKQAVESKYGKVVDLTFPQVDPRADISRVKQLAEEFLRETILLFSDGDGMDNAIHISGEDCFVFQYVTMAKEKGLNCICSTTPHIVKSGNHVKTSVFQFTRLRNYY